MSEHPKYRILPNTTEAISLNKVSLSKEEKENIKGLDGRVGCLLFGIVLMLLINIVDILLPMSVEAPPSDLVMGLIVAVIIIGSLPLPLILNKQMKASKILKTEREWYDRAVKTERERYDRAVNNEKQRATKLTNDLNATLARSSDIAAQLPDQISETSRLLAQANQEYESNAFAPYWDMVEQSAILLGRYYNNLQALSKNARHYYSSLENEKHTFPPFPIKPDNLPDPMPLVEELRRIVRLGQTNFQFANIWEHRQTRKVMIAGFNNLNDAIYGLQQTLQNSVAEFKHTVSSNIAELVEEQAKTRRTLAEEEAITRKALEAQSEDLKKTVKEVADEVFRERKR